MYSTFEYLLSPRYEFHSPVCVISDSEMKTLELQEYQLELDAILDQRKGLDEAMSAKINGSQNASVQSKKISKSTKAHSRILQFFIELMLNLE